MPSLQATADDALPRRGEQDDARPAQTSTGGEEDPQTTSAAAAAASHARALLACSAASWPLSLKRLSFATELLPLPDDIAEWLRSGGRVWLPEGSAAMPVRAEMDEFDVAEERERFGGADEGRDSDSDSSSTPSAAPPPGLSEFSLLIDAAISRLGGKALPKLDWSAPLDAAWLRPGGSLECSNADEVLLLLKSSDRISHDLEELARVAEAIGKAGEEGGEDTGSILESVSTPTLALRKWHALRPGAEFRAFLETGCRLVALCQRDITQHFEGMARDRMSVLKSVARFVRKEFAPALAVARPAFDGDPSSVPSSVLASSRLVADLYVHASGKVRLVDLAVPGGTTSPLLFESWEQVFPAAAAEEEEEEEEAEERGAAAEERGAAEGVEEKEEEIANDDASDAELSVPSSSSEGEDASDGDDAGSGSAEERRQQAAPLLPPSRSAPRVRFRVVGGARGGIAPGRTLYGAPHDFADGECVEALVERLKATEG